MSEGDSTQPAGGRTPGQQETLARWRTAESRLYPLAVADADLYQLAVQLVVEARDVLRARGASVEALLATEPDDVLRQCPSASALRDQGLDPIVAFGAACAQRMRELSVEQEDSVVDRR